MTEFERGVRAAAEWLSAFAGGSKMARDMTAALLPPVAPAGDREAVDFPALTDHAMIASALRQLDWSGASIGHKAIVMAAVVALERSTALPAEETAVVEAAALLRDIANAGLIYWEPNTSRGAEAKALMYARIETVLQDLTALSSARTGSEVQNG